MKYKITKILSCLIPIRSWRKKFRHDNTPDKHFLSKNVPISRELNHDNFWEVVEKLGNKKGFKVLEIGSREVTGKSRARKLFKNAKYVGFDYHLGENVDVVGDVHNLSNYFDKNEKFDLIYTTACFEHFVMPWVAALEITKMLKVGGHLAIETHFSFSSHERPWHFYQFSDMALKTLFSPLLGFDCIEAGLYNPIVGRFSSLASKSLRNSSVTGLYGHVNFLGKKIKEVEGFDWNKIDTKILLENTQYPKPSN